MSSSTGLWNPARRKLLKSAAGICAGAMFASDHAVAGTGERVMKTIPSSGETLPVIGMGTWQTFNVGSNPQLRADRCEVLDTFFAAGGGMVDSSPMYGSSEEVLGHCIGGAGSNGPLFSATKVWTRSKTGGIEQVRQSRELWGLPVFDLFQVHNLVGWEHHLPLLQKYQAEKTIRYVGITTSHGRRHRELEKLMESEPMDFVQLTYNILDRQVEDRLLPLAREKGIAVIANRPFQRGALFRRFENSPLPSWAGEIGCQNWAQFFLKFIVSHEAVTCAIPATSQVPHMIENMGAQFAPMPDEAMRRKMVDYVATL